MSELNVRIVRLEPMRVASTLGFGRRPEDQAWDKMKTFLERQGWMADLQAHRFFGFNNPSPSDASPNYGYEQWVTAGPDVRPQGEASQGEASQGDVRVKTFDGGLYAVTRCKLPVITDTWQKLVAWGEGSGHKPAAHQCLEECLTPFVPEQEMEFDIYLPIAE